VVDRASLKTDPEIFGSVDRNMMVNLLSILLNRKARVTQGASFKTVPEIFGLAVTLMAYINMMEDLSPILLQTKAYAVMRSLKSYKTSPEIFGLPQVEQEVGFAG